MLHSLPDVRTTHVDLMCVLLSAHILPYCWPQIDLLATSKEHAQQKMPIMRILREEEGPVGRDIIEALLLAMLLLLQLTLSLLLFLAMLWHISS